MCSVLRGYLPPGADHKSATLSAPKICLEEFKMKEDHVFNYFR